MTSVFTVQLPLGRYRRTCLLNLQFLSAMAALSPLPVVCCYLWRATPSHFQTDRRNRGTSHGISWIGVGVCSRHANTSFLSTYICMYVRYWNLGTQVALKYDDDAVGDGKEERRYVRGKVGSIRLVWRTRRRVKLWMFQKWLPVSGVNIQPSNSPLLSEVRPIYIHVYVCVRLRLVGGNRFRSKNQYAAPSVSSFVVRITLYWVSNNQANYEVSTGFRFHKFRPSFLFFLNPSCIQNSGTLKKLIIIAKVLSQFILF